MNFISIILNKRDLTNKEIFDFLRSSKDKEFLFGDDIQNYLKDIYIHANEFESVQRELDDEPVGEKRNKLVEKEGELLKWFMDQFEISKSKFGKYLKIDKK